MDAQPPVSAYASAEAALADGAFERAIDLLETVLAVDAEDIAALDLLGQVAQRIDALDSAIDAYQRVLAIDPVYRDTVERLAGAQARAGNGSAAYETLKAALTSHGHRPEFWLVMGNVMLSMALFEEAAAAYGKALEINPRSAAARMNLSEAELRRGRVDHALTLARAAAEGAPTMPGVFDNLAQILLATGHYGEAWAAFEKRFDHFGAGPQFDLKARDFPQPRWRGEPLAGRGLLVWCEQGVGDEIYYAGLFPALARMGATIAVECEPRMAPLLRRAFPTFTVVPREDPPAPVLTDGRWDFQVPAGSLMGLLRPDENPAASPGGAFLRAEPAQAAALRARYQGLRPGPLIGISWRSGNRGATHRRSIPLADWRPLLTHPDLHVLSLQYGDHGAEIMALRGQLNFGLHTDLSVDPLVNLDDFAAQVAACDAVVSVANSTIHMAAALGVPTLACLDTAPDGRWGLDRHEDGHYRSVRLYRQTRGGEWGDVMERVVADLVAGDVPADLR